MPAKGQKKNYYEPYKLKKTKAKLLKLANMGLTVEQIAVACDIAERTLQYWKKQHPDFAKEFDEALKHPTERVRTALFQRAIGYSHPEEKVVIQNGEPVIVTVTKHYPPDTAACQHWLAVYRPEEWITKVKAELSGNLIVQTIDYANASKEPSPAS